MNEKPINEKGDEENQEEYNDEFNFKESDLNKKENEENKEKIEDDKQNNNNNKLKESIVNNENENEYDNEEFIKDNEQLEEKEIEKEENDDKKEKEYIEELQKDLENDNGNDNYENNVSDFLEKDNVHLGPLIDNKNEGNVKEEKKEEEKKEEEKKDEKKDETKEEKKEGDKKEEEKKDEKKDETKEEKKEGDKKEEEKKEEEKKDEKKDEKKEEKKEGDKKEEKNKEDNIIKKEEKKDENEENKNQKKVKYIMNKKESSSNSNSELMSETEILKMSINEDNKQNKEEDKEKKEENQNNKEDKGTDDKKDIKDKNEYKERKEDKKEEENNKENKEKKEEEKKEEEKEEEEKKEEEKKEEENKEEEKKEEEKKEEEKEEENKFSRKGSESLIEDIILNELDDMPKEEIIVKNDNNKKTKIKEIKKIEIKDEKKYKTLKDLEKQPFKRVKIDSPRSLKIIKENGCVMDELYHITLDKFLNTHKETINMNKEEQKIRYNFYEELRLNQIKKLSEIRDKLIKDEELKNKEDKKLLENNNAIYHINKSKEIDIINKYENEKLSRINDDNRNSSKYRTVHSTINDMEKIKNNENDKDLVKKIILENEERIIDNKLDRIKAINDKELANVVEFELDKNLFKLELDKQTENYLKEIKQLKYENSKNDKKVNPLPNSGNAKPVVNKLTTFHENLISFHIAKKKKEYDIFQQKLDQKLEKIEMAKKKKNEELQKKKKKEYERAAFNLKRSEDIFNKKQNELIKKMQIKDLITNGIKLMNNDIYLDRKETNMQKFLSKQDYIKKLKRKDEYELEQKYKNYIERESKRGKINNIKSRIYSSRVYRMNDIQNKRKKNIHRIQKILKNGEGEDEVNLDILMEEFPDNQKIAEIIEKYQIKKNNIENNLRPRLYSSNNFNIDNNYIYSSIYNKFGMNSRSSDRKRIFIYADNNNKGVNANKKNEYIKKEERRINNASNMSNINNNNQNESLKNMYANINNEIMRKINAFKEKYPDYELSEDEDIWDEDEDIAYEHEIDERVRNFKVKIYKNFLSKLKREKRNELLRNKQLEIINDTVLRRNLEIQFSKERSLVDARLKKEGERIQKQANEYENSLRRNFQRKQQRFMNQIKDSKK